MSNNDRTHPRSKHTITDVEYRDLSDEGRAGILNQLSSVLTVGNYVYLLI